MDGFEPHGPFDSAITKPSGSTEFLNSNRYTRIPLIYILFQQD